MKNIILLLSILASFVLTDIIKAEPVKLTIAGAPVELEIVGVVGTSLQIKGAQSKLRLVLLDKESLIRVIAELGRRLKSPATPTIESPARTTYKSTDSPTIKSPASPTIEFRKRQRRKPKTK